MVLPHNLLQCLHDKYEQLADELELKTFWDHFQQCTSESLRWPHNFAQDDGSYCIPCGLHGDDLRYTDTGQKLLCVSFNFLLDDMQERYPLFVTRMVPVLATRWDNPE